MNCVLLAADAVLRAKPKFTIVHELVISIDGPNGNNNRGWSGDRGASIGTGSAIGSVSDNRFFGATLTAIVNNAGGDEVRVETYPMSAGESIGEIKAISVGGIVYNLYARGGNPYSNSYGFYFKGLPGKFPANGSNVPVKFMK